jgi:rhamnose utilization protein RhaD (predicted bifunctional aldolase and dehydrogenase)
MDETRAGCPKKIVSPEVTVATNTKLGAVTVPEAPDDTQLSLLTAISAFGDSTYPSFISKFKAFEKDFLLHRNPMMVMVTQLGQLHGGSSQNFSSLTGLKHFLCRAFLSSGRNSTMMARIFNACDSACNCAL